ncbi:hypothetical protein NKH18_35400 [Streptomyces sp. M10(2022)]
MNGCVGFGELDDHSRIADHLGLDLERPLRSLNDGYPENAVALVGKLTEKLLKELWRHHNIEGDPTTKALNDLVKRCRPHIRSSTVMDALDDIRRLRNRSTHDGYDISDEDGLLAVRRLVDVLVWFTNTGSAALLGGEPDVAPRWPAAVSSWRVSMSLWAIGRPSASFSAPTPSTSCSAVNRACGWSTWNSCSPGTRTI